MSNNVYREQQYATVGELEELRREVDKLRSIVEAKQSLERSLDSIQRPVPAAPVFGCTGPTGPQGSQSNFVSNSYGVSTCSMPKLVPHHKSFGQNCPKCKTTTVWLTRKRVTEPDEHFKVKCHSITTNMGCGHEWTEYPADHSER